jgi:hypothetical protein
MLPPSPPQTRPAGAVDWRTGVAGYWVVRLSHYDSSLAAAIGDGNKFERFPRDAGMADRTAQEARLNWRLPLYVVLGASIALLALMVYSPYGDLLYILFIAPLICLVLVLAAVVQKRPRQRLSNLLTMVAFLASSAGLCSRTRAPSALPYDGSCGRTVSRLNFSLSRTQQRAN